MRAMRRLPSDRPRRAASARRSPRLMTIDGRVMDFHEPESLDGLSRSPAARGEALFSRRSRRSSSRSLVVRPSLRWPAQKRLAYRTRLAGRLRGRLEVSGRLLGFRPSPDAGSVPCPVRNEDPPEVRGHLLDGGCGSRNTRIGCPL